MCKSYKSFKTYFQKNINNPYSSCLQYQIIKSIFLSKLNNSQLTNNESIFILYLYICYLFMFVIYHFEKFT